MLPLITVGVINDRYTALQAEHDKSMQTLVKQTHLVVELRKKLIPKDFADLNDLMQWVGNWEANNKPIVLSILNKTFVVAGDEELYSQYWDCDDISEAMQRDALKDGYLMSVALVDGRGSICDVKVSNVNYHAGCMTVVGNVFYFIEPQTGEVFLIIRRD